MKTKDEAIERCVMLTDLAEYLHAQPDTLRRFAAKLGIETRRERNPRANNLLCQAVTASDAKRITAEFKQNTGAHVLTPDEISKLMEEA